MSTNLKVISGRYSIEMDYNTLQIDLNHKKKRMFIKISESVDNVLRERYSIFWYDRIFSVSSYHADDIVVNYINNELPTPQMFSLKEYIYKEHIHEVIFSEEDMKKMIRFFIDFI